jgi:dTDP-glucose pyrophosphorylase
MAGSGSRFRKGGYNTPKYMIEAKGKTLFEWSMISLSDLFKKTTKTVFIVQREDNARQFLKRMSEKLKVPNPLLIEIDGLTDGQASSAMLAEQLWEEKEELLIYNIDTYVDPRYLRYSQIKGDGFIPCFDGIGDHWSFVRVGLDGIAMEVKEKSRISNNATIGLYYFNTCKLYSDLYREYYKDKQNIERNEKYIAPIYNLLINKGRKVCVSNIPRKAVYCLGTPEELKQFIGLK